MTAADHKLHRWSPGSADPAALDAIRSMRRRAFQGMIPPVDQAIETHRTEQGRHRWVDGQDSDGQPYDPTARMHILQLDGQPVSVANSFHRTLHHQDTPLTVLALAGVATDAEFRGRGFGKAVVQDVFKRLDEDQLPLCLFQTGQARGMYESLGAACVDNRFVNRHADAPEANPWFDRYVMVYPADAPQWPTGVIDLNGPDY